MSLLSRIEFWTVRHERHPNTYSAMRIDQAYRNAANFIKRTKQRPERPVISESTPEWAERTAEPTTKHGRRRARTPL
jgi:hypothetical protein